jgi:hypothetical protein
MKNPEALGLGVDVFRVESNRPSRPPLCANNYDAAGYASANDRRLGKRDKHSAENLENQLGSYARIAKKGGGVKFANINVGDWN